MVNGLSLGLGRVRRNGPLRLVFKVISNGKSSGIEKSKLFPRREMKRPDLS